MSKLTPATSPTPSASCDIRLRVHSPVTSWRAPVRFGGRRLVEYAGGGDTVRTGPGVEHVAGPAPFRMGAGNGWRTVAPERSIFEVSGMTIDDFPRRCRWASWKVIARHAPDDTSAAYGICSDDTAILDHMRALLRAHVASAAPADRCAMRDLAAALCPFHFVEGALLRQAFELRADVDDLMHMTLPGGWRVYRLQQAVRTESVYLQLIRGTESIKLRCSNHALSRIGDVDINFGEYHGAVGHLDDPLALAALRGLLARTRRSATRLTSEHRTSRRRARLAAARQ